ncbi:hypothetical protein LguiA_007185 [Lonicera macranthoides]
MRAVVGGGACTVQQTLTTEAACVLKHSLSLARRRGHAQVTPLHVASTLLSSKTSLLRKACLLIKSPASFSSSSPQHHHPLHYCRALELCFNVALNRLPTSPNSPLLHTPHPSLSNALIAALKRAQAHQRRGCVDQNQNSQNQNQPILAIRVEVEQLILSILDDPSVSRVMREAGFSSTAVKNNLEECLVSPVFQSYYNNNSSGGVFSSPSSPSRTDQNPTQVFGFSQTQFSNRSSERNPFLFSPLKKISDTNSVKEEDVQLVFEVLLRKKRRNTVIVGDSVSTTESLVSEVMGKIERGEVPEELKSLKCIRFQFSAVGLRFMRREEVEMNLLELKRKMDSVSSNGGGVIIYTGDLKWAVDNESIISGNYNAVDDLVREIGRLVSDDNEYYSDGIGSGIGRNCKTRKRRVWVMGIANYQTYMRCQMKKPNSLENQWSLQAVSVPSGGLGLSLNPTTSAYVFVGKLLLSLKSELNKGLQDHATVKGDLSELKRKWNRLCHSLHQGNQIHSLSRNPWWPPNHNIPEANSISSFFPETKSISFGDDSSLRPNRGTPRFRRQQSCHIEFSFTSGNHRNQTVEVEPKLDSLKSSNEYEEAKECKITLALGNSVFPDSRGKFEDILKILQENVPWQSRSIDYSIVESLMHSISMKRDAWLLINGNDSIGKRRLGLAIAEAVFGSADLLFSMRDRKDMRKPRIEILEMALKNQEKLVVLIEDVDFADTQLLKFLRDRFENGEDLGGQAIFVLTNGDAKKSPSSSLVQMKIEINRGTCKSNEDSKRKSEWDSSNKIKIQKIKESGEASLGGVENLTNSLDLNIKVDDNDDEDRGIEEFSTKFSSNLTTKINVNKDQSSARGFQYYASPNLETPKENANKGQSNARGSQYYVGTNLKTPKENADKGQSSAGGSHYDMGPNLENPLGFLESIKNRLVFEEEVDRESTRGLRETLWSKMKESFEEICKSKSGDCFVVEEVVMEEVLNGCGLFLNSLFEKWLKDVFQTSLLRLKNMGKEGILNEYSIRLCLDEKGKRNSNGLEDDGGFMGSNLPKSIKVSIE